MIYSRRMSTPRAFVKQNVCLLARFPFLPFSIGARVTHPFPYKTSCMPAHARPLARGHQAKYVLGPSVPSAIESIEVARERYYADSGISDSGAHSTLSPYFDATDHVLKNVALKRLVKEKRTQWTQMGRAIFHVFRSPQIR